MPTLLIMLLIMLLPLWLFAGMCGYIMMYFCDTAVGKGLCKGNFFVLGGGILNTLNTLLLTFIFAPLAFCVGWIALHEWKKYTRDLRNRFLS